MEYIQALSDLAALIDALGDTGDHLLVSARVLVTPVVENRYAEVTCSCGETSRVSGGEVYLDLATRAFSGHISVPISG